MRLQLLGGSLAMLWLATPAPAHATSGARAVRAVPVMLAAGLMAPHAYHRAATALTPGAPLPRSSATSPREDYTLLSRESDTTAAMRTPLTTLVSLSRDS